MPFTGEVGKDDLVGEERNPLEGGGAVGVGAAEELVLAVEKSDKFCLAELADDLVLVVRRNPIFHFCMAPR